MEDRLRAVEDAVLRINTLLPSLATKEDLAKALGDQTWKMFTFMGIVSAALVSAAFFIARYVH